MKYALITGSNGLVGSEAVEFFIKKKFKIIAIDNNFRSYFFGKNADTTWQKKIQITKFKKDVFHYNIDIRNQKKLTIYFSNIEKI